jgi:hypothetical protein
MGGHDLVFVKVEYRELYPTRIVCCQFLQNGRQSLAMASPGSRTGKPKDLPPNGGIGNEYRTIRIKNRELKRRLATATDRPFVSPPSGRDAISRSAMRTFDDGVRGCHSRNLPGGRGPVKDPVANRIGWYLSSLSPQSRPSSALPQP